MSNKSAQEYEAASGMGSGPVPSWYGSTEDPNDETIPDAASLAANGNQAEPDALKDELTQAARELQGMARQTCDMVENLTQRWEQQNAAIAERIGNLDASIARIENRIASTQGDDKSLAVDLGRRVDAVKTSMDVLTARNVDVMRQTMEFTNSSARRWTKELEEYRSLFRDSVFDDIWKNLGRIYIDILKHLKRKNDPNLTREVEYCALEPIQEMLENNGVTLFTSEPGQKRSFRRTKSRSQQPTADPELDACVVESLLPGFARGTLCLIPEVVESYVYREGYVDESQEAEKLQSAENDVAPAGEEPIENGDAQTEAPADDTQIAEEKQSCGITSEEASPITDGRSENQPEMDCKEDSQPAPKSDAEQP